MSFESCIAKVAENIRSGKFRPLDFPVYSDHASWEKLSENQYWKNVFPDYVKKAETILTQAIPEPRLSDALLFQQSGNRRRFEGPYFQKRTCLGILVLALLITGDREKYFASVIDYLGSILSEPFWCVPAHCMYDQDIYPLPETVHYADLFASATSSLLAHVEFLLGDELEKYSPRLHALLKKTVIERTLEPLLTGKIKHWWLDGWNNWTPWCSSNLIYSSWILFKDEPEKLASFVEIIGNACAKFYNRYQDDGYCDEGAHYWTAAGGSLIYFMYAIEKMTPGVSEEVLHSEKFRNMALFPLELTVSDTRIHTFADGIANCYYSPWKFCAAAKLTGAKPLLQFAQNYADHTKWEYGCGEILQFCLFAFAVIPEDFHPGDFKRTESHLFEGRLAVLRKNGMSVYLKGGHNSESHNHLDLGHATFFIGDIPVLADLGSSEYTRMYFEAATRYNILTLNAFGHNAPVFGEIGERFGEEYTAPVVSDGTTARVQLGKAYPAELKMQSFIRTAVLTENGLVLTDEIQRENKENPPVIHFYSICKNVVEQNGKLQFDDLCELSLNGIRITELKHEKITDSNLHRSWGDYFWHIVLTADTDSYSMKFIRK